VKIHMRNTGALAFFLLPGLLFGQSEHQSKPLAITHVAVIDGTGAAARPDMTVVITGERIAALGRTGKVEIPAGSEQIDGSGKFLIPGLWDMHVHCWTLTRSKTLRTLGRS
jgi:imidazolonepropionase-like amidohydrolase